MATGNRTDVVVGVDIGTTSSKAVAFISDGTAVSSSHSGYPLLASRPGYAEQRPEEVRDAAVVAVAGE